ncbi:hypothetical protein [Neobacillus mesonae]|uniref:hypothetical protein n=1 Tax=Neobacillus mesonae TaxID=1193713 RepID=UPI0013DFC4BE
MERNLIFECTQEGKALAKQRDDFRKDGPRKHTKAQILHAIELLTSHTYKEVEEMTGIKSEAIARDSQVGLFLYVKETGGMISTFSRIRVRDRG